MPELLPPSARDAESQPPTVTDLEALVIEHGCGLRPGRKGGIRLEAGKIPVVEGTESREVPVVYNYGLVCYEGTVEEADMHQQTWRGWIPSQLGNRLCCS